MNSASTLLRVHALSIALVTLLLHCDPVEVTGATEDLDSTLKLEQLSKAQQAVSSFTSIRSCMKHEYFSRCFAYCDRHCPFKTRDGRILRKPARMCLRICKSGCLCQPGYVREKRSGRCVPRRTCPYDWSEDVLASSQEEEEGQGSMSNHTHQTLNDEDESRRRQMGEETSSSVVNRLINTFAFFTNLIFS